MKTMKIGDPLPDWFMNGMGKGLIITHQCNYNGPFDHDMSQFCAFIWNGKEIQVAELGDQVTDNGDGTYEVNKHENE